MSFPDSFNLVVDYSSPAQYQSTTLNVSTDRNHIIFKKHVEYTLLESVYQTVFSTKIKITPEMGLNECQKNPACKAFVKSLFAQGFTIGH